MLEPNALDRGTSDVAMRDRRNPVERDPSWRAALEACRTLVRGELCVAEAENRDGKAK